MSATDNSIATIQNSIFNLAPGENGLEGQDGQRKTGTTFVRNNVFIGGDRAVYWAPGAGGPGAAYNTVFENNTFVDQAVGETRERTRLVFCANHKISSIIASPTIIAASGCLYAI